MNVYEVKSIAERLSGNPYAGRGIVIGRTADGKKAAVAYFIMGRSENSRNRVFVENGETLTILPFDPKKVKDPSLIIYSPVRKFENNLIVTNGDQTDTVCDFLSAGGTFAQALNTREFEPDAPNFTPRVSGMLSFAGDSFSYQMNILKSADESGSACTRENFAFPAIAGVGHFLHTYVTDGDPLPSFVGEPERVAIPDCLDAFTSSIWDNLDPNNRVSLYTLMVDLSTGARTTRLFNRHAQEA